MGTQVFRKLSKRSRAKHFVVMIDLPHWVLTFEKATELRDEIDELVRQLVFNREDLRDGQE